MHRTASVLPLLGLALAACGGLDQVDVPLSYEVTLPSGLTGVQGLPATSGGEVAQTIANQGVKPGDVDSARLTALTLTHRSPQCEGFAGCDLSFVTAVEVRVSAPGQPDVVVGRTGPPGAVRRVELDREDVELAPYVSASEMTVTVQVTIDPNVRPARAVVLGLDANLKVDVNVI